MRLAIQLEIAHDELSQAYTGVSAILSVLVPAELALAALASKVLEGNLALVIPLSLIVLGVSLGLVLRLSKIAEASLARTKEAYADLQKLITTMPLENPGTGVRVSAETTGSQDLVDMLESVVFDKKQRRS